MHISGDIQKIIGNQKCVIDTVGKSDSQVLCFENIVLKIESKNDKSDNERDLLFWLVDKLSKVGGFIDLGRSGICDKYQDIAICYRSLRDNLSGKYSAGINLQYNTDMLFDELEIVPNWKLINYYILLDKLF